MKKSSRKTLLAMAPLVLALGLGTACGRSGPESSAVKVTNGIAVNESTFPSTVLLVMETPQGEAICTGTFVNDSQVVTAGHCVEGQNAVRPQIYYATERGGRMQAVAQAVSYKRNPLYSHAEGVGPNDVAVITFPAHTAPAITALAPAAPRVGDEFTIVGYGNSANFINATGVLDGEGAGVKRAGTNTLSSVDDGMLGFAGLTGKEAAPVDGEKAGEYVSSGEGDSGGPLFVNGKLAGVTSGGGLRKTADGLDVSVSFYVDLNSPGSLKFLATALKK